MIDDCTIAWQVFSLIVSFDDLYIWHCSVYLSEIHIYMFSCWVLSPINAMNFIRKRKERKRKSKRPKEKQDKKSKKEVDKREAIP